jgi:hypothetical protein
MDVIDGIRDSFETLFYRFSKTSREDSHYEKMSNHPQVQQAQQNTTECTKRPLQNGDKAEKARKNQKLQRDVARTGNMSD